MAKKQRFRDLKQGRISKEEGKKSKKSAFNFAKRGDVFKAILTDSFMLWMPIVYAVFYLVMGGREGFAAHKMAGWLEIMIALTIVEVIFLAKSAQTPGMKAYNLKLIFLPTNSKPPITTIILRQILSKVTFMIFGWIVLFFNKSGRNLQDYITSTAFVYENSEQNSK